MAPEQNEKTVPPDESAPKEKDGAKAPGADAKPKVDKLKLFIEALSPREKTIIRVTLFVVGILFLDLIILRPITRYLARLDEEILIQEKVVPKRLLILKHKNAIIRDYKEGEPLMKDPNLAQEEEIATLLREIERVSKETGLFIFNINPVKTNKKSEAIYELSIDIEGKGGLNQIRHFMKALEAANAPIRISGFNLRPQSKESEELKGMISIAKIGVKKDEGVYEL